MPTISTIIYNYVSPVTAALIILFNTAESITILRREASYLRSSALCFILNLALSDILVGSCIALTKPLTWIHKVYYPHISAIVEARDIIQYYMLRLSLLASVFNLIIMTLVRWLAVRRPLRYRSIIHLYAVKICILVWLISTAIVTALYCIFTYALRDRKEELEIILFTVCVYPATLLFASCYYSIFKNFMKTYNNMAQGGLEQDMELVCVSSKATVTPTISHYERKVFQVALLSVVVFVICWFPIATYGLLKAAGVFKTWQKYKDLEYSLFTLTFMNSIINPIVYFLMKR